MCDRGREIQKQRQTDTDTDRQTETEKEREAERESSPFFCTSYAQYIFSYFQTHCEVYMLDMFFLNF